MSGQKMGFFFSSPPARLPPPGLNPNICFRRKTAWPLPASAAEALGTFPGAILTPQPPPGPFPSPTSPPCPWRTPRSQGRSFSTLYSLPGAFPYKFLCFTSEKQPRSGRNPGCFFPLKNSDLGAASAALSSPPKLGGLGWGESNWEGPLGHFVGLWVWGLDVFPPLHDIQRWILVLGWGWGCDFPGVIPGRQEREGRRGEKCLGRKKRGKRKKKKSHEAKENKRGANRPG